jgi:hypothetical protein
MGASMNIKDKARAEVIDLILRYDLLEDRAILWRKEHNIKLTVSNPAQRQKEKFYFYYEGDYDCISESIFTSKNYADSVRRRIRILMKKYPNLRCCCAKTKCCGSDLSYIAEGDDFFYCEMCSYQFKIDKDVANNLAITAGKSIRHMNVMKMREFRMPAVMIWESI